MNLKPIFLALAVLTSSAQAADLELNIGPVAHSKGSLMVAIYNSASSFRKDAVQQRKVAAIAGQMSLAFADLAPGEYAIALFHDANDNGKLDTNLLGIPKEGYGFSKLEKALSGPPGWDDVKFTLPAAGSKLTIAVNN
jgi:uncharacterized protein (DUF2141 family)